MGCNRSLRKRKSLGKRRQRHEPKEPEKLAAARVVGEDVFRGEWLGVFQFHTSLSWVEVLIVGRRTVQPRKPISPGIPS